MNGTFWLPDTHPYQSSNLLDFVSSKGGNLTRPDGVAPRSLSILVNKLRRASGISGYS